MRRNSRGMTLLELIITIGIITILVGLIMPATGIVRKYGKHQEASSEISQLDTSLVTFFTDSGSYPKSNQLLACLSNKYFNFDSSRVNGNTYNDPWGIPYLYISPSIISNKGYDLFSLGLLKSQGAKDTIGRIINALSTTIFKTGGVNIGSIGAWADTTSELTGLSTDMLILAALGLLRSTGTGFNLAIMINVSSTTIYWDVTLIGTGTLAYYWPYATGQPRGIYINPIFQGGPTEALAAVIAHEATHLADHMANGDTDYDSIEEEYDAKYNEAMVWKELTEGKTFTNLEDPDFVEANPVYVELIEFENEELAMIMKGEKEAKKELRKRYPEWPEKDQYGDSYVVPKKY